MTQAKNKPTILDKAIKEMRDEKNAAINTNFLKEWKPFDKLSKKVEDAILNHLRQNIYYWQPTHNEADKKPFVMVSSFNRIDSFLGFAYTSSGDFAGYWVCNSGYLWATPTHYFIGFAINELEQVVGIADDCEENSIYIIL